MLVVMSVGATEEQVQEVRRHIEADGLTPHESRGEQRVVIGVVGDVGLRKEQVMSHLAVLPGVESVTPISKPFKLTSRDFHPADTVISVGRHDHRRGSLTHHGRPLLGGEPRPAAAHGRRRRRRRGHHPARRRLQAAHEPLLLPGPGHGRRALPGGGARAHRPAHRHRGHGAVPGGESWRSTPTSCRSARATCRTTRCSWRSAAPSGRSCSSAASPPPSRSGSWPPSTSSPRATRTSSSASGASARSRPTRATRWTWRPCRCCTASRTCPSSSTRRTPPASAGWCRPWPWRPWPAALTASWSRCTPTRTTPSPTASSRSPWSSSATWRRCCARSTARSRGRTARPA